MLPSSVTTAKRAAQVGASILACFCMAGLVFGFAALKPILLDSGVYSDLCPNGGGCKSQDTRLNLLFTVASSVTNVSALPLGALLDRIGPRWASVFGAVLFGAGCFTFSLGIVKSYFDSYLVGYTLMALGSPAMFLAQFHLSNAFPDNSGLVLGAITGAFDASSLPLVFFKMAYFGHDGHPSIRTFFLAYTIIPLLLVIQQFTFGPSEVYERPSPISLSGAPNNPINPSESDRLLSAPISAEDVPTGTRSRRMSSSFSRISYTDQSTPVRNRDRDRRMSSSFSRISYGLHDDAEDEEIKVALEGRAQDGIVGVLFGKSVGEQLGSSWFWAMTFMVVVQMTRINWYLATVNTQLVYYTGEEHLASSLTDAFIFLLPLGGLISIPAIGWLLDTRPMKDVILILGLMGILFGTLTMTSTIVPQLIGIGILTVARPLFYTAISDYAAKVFGFDTFGTVYGLAMTLSGLLGLLLTPMDILTKNTFKGDYTPINVVLVILGFVSAVGMYWRVWTHTRGGKIGLSSDADVDADTSREDAGRSGITQVIVEEDEE